MVEQLTSERDSATQQLADYEKMLRKKQEEGRVLINKLEAQQGAEQERQELKKRNSELRKELQMHSKKYEDKEKYYKDKIDRLQEENGLFDIKIEEVRMELSKQKNKNA